MKQLVDWTEVVLDTLGYIQTFHGLTKTVTRPDEENNPQRYPTKIGSEETPINFEDKFAYLRVGQITDSELDDEACGKRVSRTFPLTLVVGLPNDVFSTQDEYIAMKVAQNISNSLQVTTTKALREAISAEGVEVSVSNIVTDSYEIWTTERNDDYAYPTDHFLISMLVSFVIDGHISCFEILGCDDEPAQMLQAYVDCDGTEKRWPFGEKIICTPCTQLEDQTCAALNDASTGLSITQRQQIQRVRPIQTGQTTSYAGNDDGALLRGRLVDFYTLNCNNPNGNTSRFESTDSGLTVTDWGTDKMWLKAIQGGGGVVWATALVNAEAAVDAGYSNWHLPNIKEYLDIMDFEIASDRFNWAPLSVIANFLWSSTTVKETTTSAWAGSGLNIIQSDNKLTLQNYLIVRDL